MSRTLGNNPLLKKEEPALTPSEYETIKEAISDVDDFTTMSFKVRKTYLKKFRDYAFTNRLEFKEALDQILGDFLSTIDDADLLEYPEKPKKIRKKRK